MSTKGMIGFGVGLLLAAATLFVVGLKAEKTIRSVLIVLAVALLTVGTSLIAAGSRARNG